LAKEIAKKGVEEKTVVLAKTQTLGRGRTGRRWRSPRGGIWFSIILKPQITSEDTLKLTFIMSLTAARMLKDDFGLNAEVKWPNDVLVRGRKICGILTEACTKMGNVKFVIIGVGINANIDLQAFPENLRKNATSLKHELGHSIDLKDFLMKLLRQFDDDYNRFQQGAWDFLLEEWKTLASFLGKQVQVTSFGEVFTGKAVDVTESGSLKIRLRNGTFKEVVSGEFTMSQKYKRQNRAI